jgi:protocatechuate 3,4-dioxygenase beta subunit
MQMKTMRTAIFILLASCGVQAAQDAELIPLPYLSSQYIASEQAPSSIIIAGPEEPGNRLVVTGQTLSGRDPVAQISLYIFHTDAAGIYAPGVNNFDAELNPRLYGLLRTDSQGAYRFETIMPGHYDNNAAHVHFVLSAPGFKPRLVDLWFENDPVLEARRKTGEVLVPSAIADSSVCNSLPDCVVISPIVQGANGIMYTTRDIQMIKQ